MDGHGRTALLNPVTLRCFSPLRYLISSCVACSLIVDALRQGQLRTLSTCTRPCRCSESPETRKLRLRLQRTSADTSILVCTGHPRCVDVLNAASSLGRCCPSSRIGAWGLRMMHPELSDVEQLLAVLKESLRISVCMKRVSVQPRLIFSFQEGSGLRIVCSETIWAFCERSYKCLRLCLLLEKQRFRTQTVSMSYTTASTPSQSSTLVLTFIPRRIPGTLASLSFLNCTVVGADGCTPYFHIVSQYSQLGYAQSPSMTLFRTNRGVTVASIEWAQTSGPVVHIPAMHPGSREPVSRQRVDGWLNRSPDGSYRAMTVYGGQYAWVLQSDVYCMYVWNEHQRSDIPQLLARVERGGDNLVMEISADALRAGLLETTTVAAMLLYSRP
ncbi:unnamed protein product [Mycena citricolor]|uniref:Uncharacterized protein n=2 Tax=Mycena citricolor TaxID=2018698 RepID=A0AAD2H0U1_9AGAR|nr:unnamed protein product [Mycena citricolor]